MDNILLDYYKWFALLSAVKKRLGILGSCCDAEENHKRKPEKCDLHSLEEHRKALTNLPTDSDLDRLLVKPK